MTAMNERECKLTECQGKPRCRTCLAMDARYPTSALEAARHAIDEAIKAAEQPRTRRLGPDDEAWDDGYLNGIKACGSVVLAALASAPQPPQGAAEWLQINTERMAPWTDFDGKPIFAGNTIVHPSGEAGVVVFLANEIDPSDQWRVLYVGLATLSRLCLQTGDKGRAVVVDRAALAAPPQGASSLLMADGKRSLLDYLAGAVPEDQLSDDWTKGYEECKRRLHKILAPQLAASPLPAPQEPAARFLLVSMDDDGYGNPFFCADEKAVRAALAPLLFFFNDEHPLESEHEASIDAQLECLLEDGFLNFEGDPGITLYKLHQPLYAAPAPVDEPREQGSSDLRTQVIELANLAYQHGREELHPWPMQWQKLEDRIVEMASGSLLSSGAEAGLQVAACRLGCELGVCEYERRGQGFACPLKAIKREAERLVAECAPYLKEGETPLQRIERDHGDSLALMGLLAKEKRRLTGLWRFGRDVLPTANVDFSGWIAQLDGFIDSKTSEPSSDAAAQGRGATATGGIDPKPSADRALREQGR